MKTESVAKNHAIQSVLIDSPPGKVFEFIANPSNLPLWTKAFKEADSERAIMVTPAGELSIGLETRAVKHAGTIDWYMTMGDGNVAKAFSRVVEDAEGKSIYSFILLAPPLPIEKIEGTLKEQEIILSEELTNLKRLLE